MVADSCGGTWRCTVKCKALTQFEVDTYLNLSLIFKSHCMMILLFVPLCVPFDLIFFTV